jgi:uncharacterized protein (TIGR03545 family)
MKKEDSKQIEKKEKPAKPAKAPKEKKEKPAKPPKEIKKFPTKKLPKLFKKTFTQKQFEKQIISKLYIPEDQKFAASFFKPAGQNKKGVELLSIPKDLMFEKKDLNHLETLAAEIKQNKGRIKLMPLIATVAAIAAVIIALTLTKNIIARKVITSTCESIFEAKCDIDYLNISFIKSSFRMKGWQVANKKEPMKNLFSVESVTFDFDMNQLLKARFVANELSVLGVETNTDRKYSGDISAKRLAKIQKKKEKEAKKKAKQNEKSAFMVSLESKKDAAMGTLKDSISGLFDQYNPETILKECQDQMQTPKVSKEIQEQAQALTQKYKAKPDEIKAKLETVKASSDTVMNLDVNALQSNPTKIKEALEAVNNLKTNLDSLKKDADTVLKEVQADVNGVGGLATQLQNAINNDKGIVQAQVNKFTSLNLDTGKNFITGTFDSILYTLLGKYYPYYTKAVDMLMEAKNNKKDKPKKEKKKYTITRADGRTVYYKSDSAPKFWIKKAAGSGPAFAFDATDITNNMDLTGKPAVANVTATFLNIDHKAKITVDTREASKEPLVLANYNCDKLALAYPAEKLGNIPGVPGIDSSKTQLDFILKIFENDGFSLSGTGFFTELELSAPGFEPEFVSTIYANTLQKIRSMKLGLEAGFTQSSGIDLKLITDVDKQFMNAFTAEMSNQLGAIKEKVEQEMFAKINEFSNGALGEINSFNDITDKLNGYKKNIDDLYAKVDAKKKELEDAAVGKAKAAATDAVNSAKDKETDAAKSKLKNLF